jgi:hypothetical protein
MQRITKSCSKAFAEKRRRVAGAGKKWVDRGFGFLVICASFWRPSNRRSACSADAKSLTTRKTISAGPGKMRMSANRKLERGVEKKRVGEGIWYLVWDSSDSHLSLIDLMKHKPVLPERKRRTSSPLQKITLNRN